MHYLSEILHRQLGLPDWTLVEWQRVAGSSVVCLSFWVIGISGLMLFSQLPSMFWLVVGFAGSLLVSLFWTWIRPLVFLMAGACWATWSFQQHFDTQFPEAFEGKSIVVIGQVVGLPNINASRTRSSFRVDASKTKDEQPASELDVLQGQTVQLSCYACPFDLRPDQFWQLTIRMKKPHGYASWGAFDYEKYLFRYQVVATGYVRTKEDNQLRSDGAFSVDQYRAQIREYLNTALHSHPRAKGMIAALMIGDKSSLSSEQRTLFQATGVSHLMAISGLHVGLVFLVVAFLFKWLLMPFARVFEWCPRQIMVLFPALGAALIYSALAGFAVSTQRAIVMLTVFVICKFIAREVNLLRVLLISASILLLLDPFSILDIGFWLSCGAVLIIAITAPADGSLSLVRLQPLLWLGMIPLTMLFFGQVSLVSPLVNLIMVPLFCSLLIPLVLLSLVLWQFGLESLSSSLLAGLARGFEWVDTFLAWLHQLPWALYYPAALDGWEMGILVAGLLAYFLKWRQRHVFAVLAVIMLTPNRFNHLSDNEVWISLLDVGQGLAMVVESHDYTLVYDTGPAYPSGFNTADAVLLPYLRQRGVRKIDDLIISHADNDHIGGYAALHQALPVERTLSSRPDQLVNAQHCQSGQAWTIGANRFEILSPSPVTPQGSNNQSCVLMVRAGDTKVLITGDIERPVEQHLLRQELDLQADILLVPHQGSKTSSTGEFIDAVNPRLAVVAAGYRNHYGHPHEDVVTRYHDRGIKLLSTVENGSIALKINNNSWHIDAFRTANKGFWHRQKKPN